MSITTTDSQARATSVEDQVMTGNQKILVAVDGSPTSWRTVRYVADMVGGLPGIHVGMVHFELPPRMLEWGGAENENAERTVSVQRAEAYRGMEKEVIEAGQFLLKRLHDLLAEKATDVITQVVRFEEPLDAKTITSDLLKMAKERGYGTIVVGKHSFAGLKRWFAHHVGEELVRTADGVTVWVVE
jgi:K+-sensing histidine kinase KdpD